LRLAPDERSRDMNWYFLSAGILAFIIGLTHSVLGEIHIFSRMRRGGMIPIKGGVLGERHVRILWASWHVLTVLGWGMAALLIWLSLQLTHSHATLVLQYAVTLSMFLGSVLVLVGTKAKHPGWVGLLGVSVLVICWR
jgi:hypothetical protein